MINLITFSINLIEIIRYESFFNIEKPIFVTENKLYIYIILVSKGSFRANKGI